MQLYLLLVKQCSNALGERSIFFQYEGVIQKGNENLVHHMEVFHCEVPADEIVRHFNGPGISEGSPEGLAACRKVIGAWAMGASVRIDIMYRNNTMKI